jgi:hypothetical protein
MLGLVLTLARSAAAQSNAHVSELRVAFGFHGLGNQDPAVGLGAGWAYRVTPRLRIEPEVQALWWETCVDEGPPIGVDCSDGVIGILDANGAVDLGNPARRSVTYVIGGAGVRFGGGDNPISGVSMHGGLGLRVWPSRRFFLAPEARFLFTAGTGQGFQLAVSTGLAQH